MLDSFIQRHTDVKTSPVSLVPKETATLHQFPLRFPDKIEDVVHEHSPNRHDDEKNVGACDPVEKRFLLLRGRHVHGTYSKSLVGPGMTLPACRSEIGLIDRRGGIT